MNTSSIAMCLVTIEQLNSKVILINVFLYYISCITYILIIKYRFLKQNQQTFHFIATLHQIGCCTRGVIEYSESGILALIPFELYIGKEYRTIF